MRRQVNRKALTLSLIAIGLALVVLLAPWVAPVYGNTTDSVGPQGSQESVRVSAVVGTTNKLVQSEESLKVYLGLQPFDPLESVPDLPRNLSSTDLAGQAYWLVQLEGPVLAEWQDQLGAAGYKIVDYVPDFTYIGKMDTATMKNVAALPFVRWVGPY